MSLVHIRLNQIFNDDKVVSYKVESPDFSKKNFWEDLGTLRILKTEKSYEFIGSQLAEDNKLIPPELYDLSEEERKHKLNYKYANYGLGAWSMCIHHWAKTLLSNNEYPEKYPT